MRVRVLPCICLLLHIGHCNRTCARLLGWNFCTQHPAFTDDPASRDAQRALRAYHEPNLPRLLAADVLEREGLLCDKKITWRPQRRCLVIRNGAKVSGGRSVEDDSFAGPSVSVRGAVLVGGVAGGTLGRNVI